MVEPQMRRASAWRATVRVPRRRSSRAPTARRLEQILLNLLGNAVKFTPAGGRVRVDRERGADDAPACVLRVRDTGIGIPPERLPSVFEPFVQVDTSRTRGARGHGARASPSAATWPAAWAAT